MSPRNLVFLLVLGLCATQMVSAHREARGVKDLLNSAKNKLEGLINKVKDAAGSSVEVVVNYIGKLEHKVLEAGTKRLKASGIELDLNTLSAFLKSNAKTCARDENIKAGAKSIIRSVGSCVTKEIDILMNIVSTMKTLWKTARRLPDIMEEVSVQCGAHVNTDPMKDVLDTNDIPSTVNDVDEIEDDDDDDHDLAQEAKELLENAKHRVSKRALWNLKRITRCVKAVYSLTKNDLISIPGKILSTAGSAVTLFKATHGGIPACVGMKLAENSVDITKLTIQFTACFTGGISQGEELEKLIEENPSLAALKKLAPVSEQLSTIPDSSVVSIANGAVKFLG